MEVRAAQAAAQAVLDRNAQLICALDGARCGSIPGLHCSCSLH